MDEWHVILSEHSPTWNKINKRVTEMKRNLLHKELIVLGSKIVKTNEGNI